MSIFVRAQFHVHEGRRAEFEEVVRALRTRSESEPGTLTYRFFTTGDGYVVLEEYTDPTAAATHNENAADLLSQVFECADLAFIELYGQVGPELRAAAPRATVYPDLGE
jgi:quinol monooxygenase YgiN